MSAFLKKFSWQDNRQLNETVFNFIKKPIPTRSSRTFRLLDIYHYQNLFLVREL